MILHVGFTGTQRGMTTPQENQFFATVRELSGANPDGFVFHHGDCVGADEDARNIIAWHTSAMIVSHPPDIDAKRAFTPADVYRVQKPYLERNQDIVNECEILIATPGEDKEQLRSGTWATIRRGRKKGMLINIILPSGEVRVEDRRVHRAGSR